MSRDDYDGPSPLSNLELEALERAKCSGEWGYHIEYVEHIAVGQSSTWYCGECGAERPEDCALATEPHDDAALDSPRRGQAAGLNRRHT